MQRLILGSGKTQKEKSETHRTEQDRELAAWAYKHTTKRYLYSLKERRVRAMEILDQIEKISTSISTGEGNEGGGGNLSAGNNWWRCRDLNPGHCGYEPHALTN